MIFQFKATLQDVNVPVWRIFEIDGNATFSDFHKVMQQLFDWKDSHLYSFFVKKSNGTSLENIEIAPENDKDFGNRFFIKYIDDQEILADWFLKEADSMTYVYDFKDEWQHDITFIKKYKPKKQGFESIQPVCLNAENDAPPEASRFEVIQGTINLTNTKTKEIVESINEVFLKIYQPKGSSGKPNPIDYWPETLKLSKQFLQVAPWSIMDDEHIFAIKIPSIEQVLFCSVLGKNGEVYGLAVYIGIDGFLSLVETLTTDEPEINMIHRQHSLLVTFEDRTDLEKDEYEFIKSYATSFRGKKSWPSFVSFKPGFYPWMMNNEEAGVLSIALQQTIAVYHEIQNGLTMPYIPVDDKILMRRSDNEKVKNQINYVNRVMTVEDILTMEAPEVLTLSEIGLKRLEKIKKPMNMTVEFVLTPLHIPVQQEEGDRPFFPTAVFAVQKKRRSYSVSTFNSRWTNSRNCSKCSD